MRLAHPADLEGCVSEKQARFSAGSPHSLLHVITGRVVVIRFLGTPHSSGVWRIGSAPKRDFTIHDRCSRPVVSSKRPRQVRFLTGGIETNTLPFSGLTGCHFGDSGCPGSAQRASPLLHCNWRGIGDINRGRPADALDAACRAHDLCYERTGWGACACDRAFLKATATITRRRKTDETVRTKATMANTIFALTPCAETGKSPPRAGKR
ncbi:hypothetical protein [Microvirga makkahensis]|uniref:Phospholipase A2 domain-containing protein n=1 Tax=Microvirga makkahensis TaxID=1128670 RepID=A0A7X3MMX4_9HYPH|nr:hypothetical protein [Microvirga makkahensis]MXQ09999.1 hypothetical protein [Microvirga makkahensis]